MGKIRVVEVLQVLLDVDDVKGLMGNGVWCWLLATGYWQLAIGN
jgi:hypothetical protein